MVGPGAGISQRLVRWLEPPALLAVLVHAVVAVVLWTQLSGGDLPEPAHRLVLAMFCLTVVAGLVYLKRWITFQRVLRLSRDPRYAREYFPDAAPAPRRPSGVPQAVPRVDFRTPRRIFAGVGRRQRVAVDRNVLGRRPLNIVYLRVFENRPRARTFARGAWREFGHVHLLRSAGAVSATEFLRHHRDPDFFIRTHAQLRGALAGPQPPPQGAGWRFVPGLAGSKVLTYDRFGAYPMRALMCHGDFWRTALDVLIDQADLVVLDLSGFHPKFGGTLYEIDRVIDRVPIREVVLLADPKSKERFIRHQVQQAWASMDADSPNLGRAGRIPCYRIDYFLEHRNEHGGVVFTELRSSRTQTRALLREAQDRLGVPAGDPGADPPPRLWWQWPIAAAVVAVVAALALGPVMNGIGVPRIPWGPWFAGGTSASVVPGSGFNLRAGPTTNAPVVGALPAGTDVVIECLDGNWARLSRPQPGTYVYADGLVMAGRPAGC